MKHFFIALCLLFLNQLVGAQSAIDHKVYDTEYGRFDLWIYADQLTGSYEIAPKKIIGSITAELKGLTAEGRWMDPDGMGDIVLTFEKGFEKFRADYRADKEPEKWYRDQWHGQIQVNKKEDADPCSGPLHALIRPFIGTWEEFRLTEDEEEEFIGTLMVALEAGGCALHQRFISPDSSFFYTTQGYVNTGSGFWEEKYVFSTGSTADYQWVVDKGEIVQRRVGGTRQLDHQHQLRFTELNDAGYLLLQEESTDSGKTWQVTGRTRVRRKG